ncbi:MAG TPA: alpha/beta hydrolase [Gemmatimonadaceae bacterium]|nr:alpha/beta hydrolase [Gemmatimonadaceae bacterium]
MKRWAKRIAVGVGALLVLAIVVGSVAEMVLRRRAARAYPAPGQLVDIGGRRMQLDCRGSGSPTVVLESGLDNLGSLSWALVHDSIAATSRTCAYSRAGIMWSDPASGAFDSKHVSEDLHAALAKAGERPPFVVVGHSLGGPYALLFTGLYPSDVAGLVFVDASHPDQLDRLRKATGNSMEPPTGMLSAVAALSWTGIIRLVPDGAPNKLPPAAIAAAGAYTSTSLEPTLHELKGLAPTLQAAGQYRQLGDRPLVVLTAMAPMSDDVLKGAGLTRDQGERMRVEWKALHDDEATWSTHSRHELVPDATHYIQLDRPDVVIKAVREVVGEVRSGVVTDSTESRVGASR